MVLHRLGVNREVHLRLLQAAQRLLEHGLRTSESTAMSSRGWGRCCGGWKRRAVRLPGGSTHPGRQASPRKHGGEHASARPRAPPGEAKARRGEAKARGRGRGCARATLQLQSMSLPAPRSGARAHPRHRTRAARDVWPAPASPSPSTRPSCATTRELRALLWQQTRSAHATETGHCLHHSGCIQTGARTHARARAATSPAAGGRHTIRRRHAREAAREGNGRRLARKRAEGELRANRGRHG